MSPEATLYRDPGVVKDDLSGRAAIITNRPNDRIQKAFQVLPFIGEDIRRTAVAKAGAEQVRLDLLVAHVDSRFAPIDLHGISRQTEILVRQREILQEIAEAGQDCVIVGRDADVILHAYQPFRIGVCADLEARLERCMRYEEKRTPEERMTEKEILRNIRRIDRDRKRTREILTGKTAGDASTFDLTVNSTGWEIKKLAEAVAEYSGHWFEK